MRRERSSVCVELAADITSISWSGIVFFKLYGDKYNKSGLTFYSMLLKLIVVM